MDAHPIVVERLTHRYRGASRLAVDQLSFEVKRGEIVGLLGPNGAGKTTTLHALLGLLQPQQGAVRMFGEDPIRARDRVLPRLNFAAADVDLPSNLRVSECLAVYAKLYSVADARGRIGELVEQFSLQPLLKRKVGTMSSGEQMRLKICKALLNRPELLLLDEPTLSLDPHMAKTVRDSLRAIQRERQLAVLHTSHNMREVETFCDRILFLHQGRLVTEGPPQEVVDRFQSRTLEDLFIRLSASGELHHVG